MTAFDRAWELVKEEIGVKGTPCPQCGAQYDPDENEWTATVGYDTMFKQPYFCHDCDIHWDGPSGGEREEDESARQNWQTGRTKIGGDEFDFTMSPIQEGGSMKEMLEAFGAFMQDRVGDPAAEEAKKRFLEISGRKFQGVPYMQLGEIQKPTPYNADKHQTLVNIIMPMSSNDFIQFLEMEAEKDDRNLIRLRQEKEIARLVLDEYRSTGGMDEGEA
tara:strand:- start:288 stop:941 length:654 start_codon:yes stop_codon:yes gene_type:complete